MSATPAPANPSSEPRILSTFRAVEFWWLKIPEELRYLFLCLTAWGSSTDVRTRRQRIATGFPLALIAIAITISFLNPHAKAAPEAKHGLIGQYYVSQLPGDSPTEHRLYFTQIWTNRDDFQLPHALTDPAVTRVDAQIAFGQSRGFAATTASGHRAAWAPADYPNPPGWGASLKPSDYFAAAIWRGYIHLPKAGTYYFATVSSGPSAVYLNQSRVALNGPSSEYGGLLTSDNFTYDNADVQDFIQNVRGSPFAKRIQDAYAIPVTVEGPRDLPIEVRYNAWRTPSGIDLFWVTPDAPHDAGGKPLAKLVSSDALYTEAPGPIEKPLVRSANSTISADLYCSALEETKPLTLSIRLADKEGRPVAGKRVVFVTLADDKFGYDDTIQPDKPTDENGIATAHVRATSGARGHDSTIYATDVTDLVDVGQLAHVRFPHVENSFFVSPCSDGYDPNVITVEPLPMMVGRPATLKVRLENRQKSEAELSATFQATDWNIGSTTWDDIGRVDNIRLKPGESKEVDITWVPKQSQAHQCFRVQLRGRVRAAQNSATRLLPAAVLPWGSSANVLEANVSAQQHELGPPQYNDFYDSLQRNLGSVAKCAPTGNDLAAPPAEGCKPNADQKQRCEEWWVTTDLARDNCILTKTEQVLAGKPYDARGLRFCTTFFTSLSDAYIKCAADPPSGNYRHLAVAATDDPAAYINAMTGSMERLQGAQDAGDRDWTARQVTAMRLYEQRAANAMHAQADALAKQAEGLPPDDPSTLAAVQKAQDKLLTRLRQGGGWTNDELKAFQDAGISPQVAKNFIPRILAIKNPPVKGQRALLLDTATFMRKSADQQDQIASSPISTGEEGKPGQPMALTYSLANPHDREEDVDLYIRPLAIPLAWKLSVVTNAAPSQAQGQKPPTPPVPPEFPVHEVEPGKHYVVHLPAKRQIKVASVVVPVGEMGANTTARWVVEGKIRDESIGAMVHEVSVPYIVADLKLPAVGSKEEVEQPIEQPAHKRSSLEVAITAAGVVILAILAFVLLRRRRKAQAA